MYNKNDIIKFKSMIKKTKSCWIWKGYTTRYGYGIFNTDKGQLFAHRVSYEIFVGKIKKKMCICHKCDNPKCVNPKHLFIGTQADNMLDMKLKGRSTKGRPPWCLGKKLSEETKKKMSENNVGMLGKKHSEETKKKMSKSRKGSKNSFYGKTHSDESKIKISISQKRRLAKIRANKNG